MTGLRRRTAVPILWAAATAEFIAVSKRGDIVRKIRSDCTVGTLEKKYGLPAGTIRNKDGRDTRSDKKIGTIRKEAQHRK